MAEETVKNETLLIEQIITKPIKEHLIVLYNHFSRYYQAVQSLSITAGDFVIDASCGCGYGSYILAAKAGKVVGLDVNEEYLKKAIDVFSSDNIDFYSYEQFELLRSKGIKAQKIVCIETYEHIAAADIDVFLERLFSYLDQKGKVFLTVPLGEDVASSYNIYHLNEPSIATLYHKLTPYFKQIDLKVDRFINSFGYETNYCYLVLQ